MGQHILTPQDPQLRQPCEPLTPVDLRQPKTQKLIEKMINFVYQRNTKTKKHKKTVPRTVGLSANQIGINKRISIVDLAIGKKKFHDVYVLINPEIIWKSRTKIEKQEGCVNLPDIWGHITRSKRIKVKALDRSGNKLLLDLNGWPAVLLQHEIDHLNGTLFIDHLENPARALSITAADYPSFKQSPKTWEKFTDVSHLVKSPKSSGETGSAEYQETSNEKSQKRKRPQHRYK
jgi:peptide deformylase